MNVSEILGEPVAPKLKLRTGRDILTGDYPKPEFLIDDFLMPGLTLFYGKPKIGKSVLSLQLAKALGGGTSFLGKAIKQCKVLFLDLEESNWLLKERMQSQGWVEEDAESVTFLTIEDNFETSIGYLNDGGIEKLVGIIKDGEFEVVILDMLIHAVDADVNDYAEMKKELRPIHVALHTLCPDVALIVIHHSRKQGAQKDDIIDGALGSIGITGAADIIWVLHSDNNNKTKGILEVKGRSIRQSELKIMHSDDDAMLWVFADEDLPTDSEQVVLDALVRYGPMIQAEIARKIDKTEKSTSRWLANLFEKGWVISKSCKTGVYWEIEQRELL